MVQRVISAFVYRDAELVQTPFRRAGGTLFLGAMIGVLALAAVGIYGVVVQGGKKSWRNDKVLVVEKETGARYVYLNRKLHPVVNYVSARLILKQGGIATVMVSRASLRDATRGPTLGIVGLPDSLPERNRLIRSPWVLCTRSVINETGQSTANSALFVGRSPAGGRRLGEQALLVRTADGTTFLVWHDHRYLIRSPQLVLNAMALSQAPVIQVATGWVNALPSGVDIGPIDIPQRGANAPLTGAKVGQVLSAESVAGIKQYYAVLEDGIADITPIQADILISDSATAAAYPGAQPRPVSRTDLASAKRSARRLAPAGDTAPPTTRPEVAIGADHGGTCAAFGDIGKAPPVSIGMDLPAAGTGIHPSGAAVDEVVVTSGGGVLAQSAISPETTDGTLAVVTDLGIRYSLASREVANYLGYSTGSSVRVPAALLALLPQGPALEPEAAGSPVAPAG
jgi:type VII secretion protein EccB